MNTHPGATAARFAATEPRLVTAVCQFRGLPGQEEKAALAWAFELKYYFRRGVGEQPEVTYSDGVYTVTGLMQTTHPHDVGPVVYFDRGHPWDLDGCTALSRMAHVRQRYETCKEEYRWDGR